MTYDAPTSRRRYDALTPRRRDDALDVLVSRRRYDAGQLHVATPSGTHEIP